MAREPLPFVMLTCLPGLIAGDRRSRIQEDSAFDGWLIAPSSARMARESRRRGDAAHAWSWALRAVPRTQQPCAHFCTPVLPCRRRSETFLSVRSAPGGTRTSRRIRAGDGPRVTPAERA